MTMASAEPAITIFSRLVFCSATVGFTTSLPSSRPTRTQAMGLVNGSLRNVERGRSGGDADDVRIVFAIRGEHHGDDLRFGRPALGKQRAQRTIDQARREDFALGGAAFALEEAAGNFAGGIGVLAVVDREREKIFFGGLVVHARCGEHDRVAIARHDGAVRLAGHFARFEGQLAAAQIQTYLFEHPVTSFCPGSPGTSSDTRECLGKASRRGEGQGSGIIGQTGSRMAVPMVRKTADNSASCCRGGECDRSGR